MKQYQVRMTAQAEDNILEYAEHINCEGCRIDGIKTVYCDSLCPIRQCALEKGVTTCGDCPEREMCRTVGMVVFNNSDALKNLKG